ncbi:hypothetical protein SAMN04489868_11250 [Pisciglobus halotolerans]|uniref:Uncharacterized protein n=2 Tax=Pisciglobus halotolerans TaxID=745365 RepID=A0A1I3C2H3_9LACT|nr:hypothetical protein SAMN04489868_11250 [Pisciglobus halotolerans]
MEPTFYWWKPRKKHTRPPSNWVASVYGIVATEEYLEPDEIDRLDYIYLGYMTREEMLELTGVGCR